jgi:hypothetical protein
MTAKPCAGASGKGSGDSGFQRTVGEVGKNARDTGQIPYPGKISNCGDQRYALPLLPQGGGSVALDLERQRLCQCAFKIALFKLRDQLRLAFYQSCEERAVLLGTRQGCGNPAHFLR